MLARLVSLIGIVGIAACAAPSSFDGLTGGTPKPESELRTRAADPTMDAPRPIAPISVSWVSTLRPTFKWKSAAGSTGAVLEICRTRACDGDEVRRIDVEGETVTVPDDLEAGVWFWRVFGTSKERVGTKPSATWEVVVRGGGPKGSSDIPTGNIVDVNGDGFPDLVVTGETWDWNYDDVFGLYPDINVWFGDKDGKLHPKDLPIVEAWAEAGDDQIAAIDTDGDGFTDVARSLKVQQIGEQHVDLYFGGPGKPWKMDEMSGWDYFDWDKEATGIVLPGNTAVPALREGGDVNGDGYGDFVVAATNAAVIGLGSAKGTAASMPLMIGGPANKLTPAAIGAFDADGDGLSDMVFAGPIPEMPLAAARGDRERVELMDDLMPRPLGTSDKAIAFASGDFDGDGLADLAATLTIDGRRNVCIWLGNRAKFFVQSDCFSGPIGDAHYGDHLTTGDLTARGQDDILVSGGEGATSFVEIIALDGGVSMVDRIRMPGIGGKLTTIWPGRPGKARWATVDSDGLAVLVFEGRTLLQSITTIGKSRNFVYPDFKKTVRSIR